MEIKIPDDVNALIRDIFKDCNAKVARKLTNIPNLHETSLDHSFIEHFTHHCRPVQTPSDWIVRIDCHFIGGGRHYMRWEVADFGILVVFRHKGAVVRSKVSLLQSKRLFPIEGETPETNPLDRDLGFNSLFMDDDRWSELSSPRVFNFESKSLYRSLQVGDEQFDAIEKYEKRHKIPVHYLLYNPTSLPSTTTFPIVQAPSEDTPCVIGCRIVPSKQLREMVKARTVERPPSYLEISTKLAKPFSEGDQVGGWRFESYIVDSLLACKDGLIDDDPRLRHISHIFSQKSMPIHAAILITLDMPTAP